MSGVADDDLLKEFVTEARDHLESVEPDLLAMEKDGIKTSSEIINSVFRAIHSVKGASGFFGLTPVTGFSHIMESLLAKVRDGSLSPHPELVDVLLAGVDKLRLMLDDIENCGNVQVSKELAVLNRLLGVSPPPAGHSAPVAPAPVVNTPAPSLASSDGKMVSVMPNLEVERSVLAEAMQTQEMFLVSVHVGQDLTQKGRRLDEFMAGLEVCGACLAVDLDASENSSAGELEADTTVHFVFATVLEQGLVGPALDIPDEQVSPIDARLLDAPVPLAEPAAALEPLPDMPAASSIPSPKASSPPKKDQETIRVNVELLDCLMNIAGELVLGRNQLRKELEGLLDRNSRLGAILQHVGQVTTEIQENIMRIRMQPLGSVLNKFPRIVRDLAKQLEKEVELDVVGSEVELDKSIIERLADPLTHLIRNCMDHGIEEPEERVKNGKSRVGRIRIHAFHEGGQVNITITDDGYGIDAERVAAKAVAKGFLPEADIRKMNEQEKLKLIFLPGLSTAQKVSDVSGRGVGMDVVKTNIEKLSGHLQIESAHGKGTEVRIRLPLTLAIIPSLIVGAEKFRFAVPQMNVKELLCIRAGEIGRRIEKIGDADILRLRGQLLPLVELAEVLNLSRTYADPQKNVFLLERRKGLADQRAEQDPEPGEGPPCSPSPDRRKISDERRRAWRSDINVVVLRAGPHQFGLCVDELYDTEEIVVKPLARHIERCRCFAGATIMGDGRVAMILDTSGIAESAGLRFGEIAAEELQRREKEIHHQAMTSRRHSIIVFNNAWEEFFALPLARIARLEKIAPSDVECVGGREFITQGETALPLLRLEKVLSVRPAPDRLEELYLIVPKSSRPVSGIVATRIVDTIETEVSIQEDMAGPGLLGAAVVQDHLTFFLDVDGLLALASHEGDNNRLTPS